MHSLQYMNVKFLNPVCKDVRQLERYYSNIQSCFILKANLMQYKIYKAISKINTVHYRDYLKEYIIRYFDWRLWRKVINLNACISLRSGTACTELRKKNEGGLVEALRSQLNESAYRERSLLASLAHLADGMNEFLCAGSLFTFVGQYEWAINMILCLCLVNLTLYKRCSYDEYT